MTDSAFWWRIIELCILSDLCVGSYKTEDGSHLCDYLIGFCNPMVAYFLTGLKIFFFLRMVLWLALTVKRFWLVGSIT